MPGTPATSPKFGTPRYANADAVDFAGQVNAVTDSLEKAMRLDKGLASARPAAAIADRWYYATDTRELSRDTGSAWESPSTPETAFATGVNGPAKGSFGAYRSSALSVTTGTTVLFNTEEFDLSAWYDPATGRYTPQIAGYYTLAWSVTSSGALAADSWWQANLHKNGSLFKGGSLGFQRGVVGLESVGCVPRAVANGTTDFFTVVATHNQGTTFPLATGVASTWFNGGLAGRS